MKCTYVLLPTGMHTRHLWSVYRSPWQVTCKFVEFLFCCCFKINMINFVVFLLTLILNIFCSNLMSLTVCYRTFFAPKLLKTLAWNVHTKYSGIVNVLCCIWYPWCSFVGSIITSREPSTFSEREWPGQDTPAQERCPYQSSFDCILQQYSFLQIQRN